MAEIFEIIMVLCFGASWPMNIMRSYRARTAKGKSLAFLVMIEIGYVAGIISKFVNEAYMADFGSKWYVLVFYCINFVMVGIDMILYFRNVMLDKKAAAAA
ncbi:MAG: hypothetical protein IKC32_01860 [Clostridia bacterium]|nr:hypothetical protein [Clostridia bacterium]